VSKWGRGAWPSGNLFKFGVKICAFWLADDSPVVSYTCSINNMYRVVWTRHAFHYTRVIGCNSGIITLCCTVDWHCLIPGLEASEIWRNLANSDQHFPQLRIEDFGKGRNQNFRIDFAQISRVVLRAGGIVGEHSNP